MLGNMLLEDMFWLIIICYYIFPLSFALTPTDFFVLYKLYLFVPRLKFKPYSSFCAF